jgi:hypothetical protein
MDSNCNSYTNAPKFITLTDAIAHQSQPNGWICEQCKHHGGNLNCGKNMFIAFVGCYTKDCQAFEDKDGVTVENSSSSIHFDYSNFLEERKKKWLDENCHKGMLLTNGITPLRPDIGFYLTVDNIDISQDIFPEEFNKIQEARYSVITKLRQHYNNTKR